MSWRRKSEVCQGFSEIFVFPDFPQVLAFSKNKQVRKRVSESGFHVEPRRLSLSEESETISPQKCVILCRRIKDDTQTHTSSTQEEEKRKQDDRIQTGRRSAGRYLNVAMQPARPTAKPSHVLSDPPIEYNNGICVDDMCMGILGREEVGGGNQCHTFHSFGHLTLNEMSSRSPYESNLSITTEATTSTAKPTKRPDHYPEKKNLSV